MSYPPKSSLFIRGHLGLGDALIMNGLARHAANEWPVIFPAKTHNVPSVQFMFRDEPNIAVLPVKDDAAADALCQRHPGHALKLGMFGKDFTFEKWDEVCYRQAGVPFDVRWSGFHFERDRVNEMWPHGEYAFLHEDSDRGMVIDDNFLPSLAVVQAERRNTIFDYAAIIENATEIHVIDSAFLSLCESIPTRATRLVLHLYAREDAKPPTLRKNWEIIK